MARLPQPGLYQRPWPRILWREPSTCRAPRTSLAWEKEGFWRQRRAGGWVLELGSALAVMSGTSDTQGLIPVTVPAVTHASTRPTVGLVSCCLCFSAGRTPHCGALPSSGVSHQHPLPSTAEERSLLSQHCLAFLLFSAPPSPSSSTVQTPSLPSLLDHTTPAPSSYLGGSFGVGWGCLECSGRNSHTCTAAEDPQPLGVGFLSQPWWFELIPGSS